MKDKIGIKRIVLANVSGFLVYTDSVAMMVDTGHKGMCDRILKALIEVGHSPETLQLIVLTHSHYDHAGGAAELKQLSGARVLIHASEADQLRQGRTTIPDGTRWKGKLIAWTGRRFAKKVTRLNSLEADIFVDEKLDLNGYGIPGYILHTPGHTSGSLSVILENGSAIVGDNMLGITGKEHYPPFADDQNEVLKSWQKLIETGSQVFYPGHGAEVKIGEIVKELPGAVKKYGDNVER
ncbi:MAG: MBL fold metallo-hydrolase [Bacteroidetes bacterium]|jgi:hydroxyacylglutathione hydrolase|nr:MBL fold metallo-hydrolase [Bacteroidota bacterium]